MNTNYQERAGKAADPDKIRAGYGKDGAFICYDYPTANPSTKKTQACQYHISAVGIWVKSRPAY